MSICKITKQCINYKSNAWLLFDCVKRAAAKIAPKLLNFEQGDVDDVQRRSRRSIITGNESWMYGYDIETKAQLHQASRSVPKSQDRKNYVKFVQMSNGVVHQEFLPRGRTNNKEYYQITPMEASRSFVHCFLRLQWLGKSWIFATRPYGQ